MGNDPAEVRKPLGAASDERRRNGRNWARTSDPQLVELVLSQLSYAPGTAFEFSRCYATGAAGGGAGTGTCSARGAESPTPFACIVISNVSRLV